MIGSISNLSRGNDETSDERSTSEYADENNTDDDTATATTTKCSIQAGGVASTIDQLSSLLLPSFWVEQQLLSSHNNCRPVHVGARH